MWKLIIDSLWGDPSEGETVWRSEVSDEEVSNMRSFLSKHLWGDPSDYSIERCEGRIIIAHGATGNTILELRRVNN